MMRRSMALLALAGAGVAACDSIPTELPSWEQTWAVPAEAIEVSVAELLPASVGLNGDSTAFVVTTPGTSISVTLAEMGVPGSGGFAAPKPAFSHTLNTTTTLPSDLATATLSGGEFALSLAHSFQFDPLNPSSEPTDPKGSISISVTSDGNVLADTVIDGANTTWTTGTTLTPVLPINPVSIVNDLAIAVEIVSPSSGSDTYTYEASDSIGVTLEPSTLEISEAEVAATSITLDGTSTPMDFAGIEEDGFLVERIQSGSLIFDIQNPFAIDGSLDMAFQLPGQTIQRSLALEEGSYQATLDFTGDELRSILGSEQVDVVTSGTISGTGPTITITPSQEMILDSRFQVVLLVGGMEEDE